MLYGQTSNYLLLIFSFNISTADQKELVLDLRKGDLGKQLIWEGLFVGEKEVEGSKGLQDVVEGEGDVTSYDDMDVETKKLFNKMMVN